LPPALPPPSWDLLSAFLVVAEAGGLSAAARGGALSQPTLSRRIEALEDALGVPVFERTARGLKLTEAGVDVLTHVRAMRDEAQAVGVIAAERKNAWAGPVRITTSQVLSTFFLPAVITQIRVGNPGLSVVVSSVDDVENLLEREADIALRVTRPDQASLIGRKVGVLRIGAYAHRAYIARRGAPRTIADLADHDLIGGETDGLLRRTLKRLGAQIEPANFSVRSDNQALQWNAVRAGAGVGFIATFVGDAAAKEGVKAVLAEVEPVALPLWVVARKDVRALKRVRAVFDALCAAAAKTFG
jgi:DNA-binding transcriptional LysR family regulator